jgi:glycosyltransferase involved in cell wall biosynthesis
VLLFAEHPHPDLTPRSVSERVRKLARKRGWLGSAVRFESWRPFERRFELPQVADLAVVTHQTGLETDLSLRTRLVDLMWLGLPSVVTSGGSMARVVEAVGAGAVVAPGDADALAVRICELIADPGAREQAGMAARTWARRRTWQEVSAPLLRFAEKPWRDPNRERFDGLAPGEVMAEEPLLRRIQRRLRRQRSGR